MAYKDDRKERMKKKIMSAIMVYTLDMGYPPTFDEIGEMVGLRSKATVSWYLGMLRAEGKISWENGKPRTVRLVEK